MMTMTMFRIHIQPPMGRKGAMDARMMARPEVPPKAKCCGLWNSTIENAVTSRLRLRAKKKRQRLGASSRLRERRRASSASSDVWVPARGSRRTGAGSMGRNGAFGLRRAASARLMSKGSPSLLKEPVAWA